MIASSSLPRRLIDAAAALARSAGVGAADAEIIAHGGSDRYFVRFSGDPRPVVALIEPGGGPEFDRYIEIGRFLQNQGIGVPEQRAVDREAGILIMEDLGDTHLDTHLAQCTKEEGRILYEKCLGALVELQTTVTARMIEEELLHDTIFDRETLLGETTYFEREFVREFAGIDCPPDWESERMQLAERLAAEPTVFMHRDFQSRNVMLADGRIRIIDFQTAHRGPGIYDVASLLKDPYSPLPTAARNDLLKRFHGDLLHAGRTADPSYEHFRALFIHAGIQRNCQALAAYAYLGLKKGKRGFLDSIPAGLALLEDGIAESGGFDALGTIVRMIRERNPKGML